jgi:hypothetical protein
VEWESSSLQSRGLWRSFDTEIWHHHLLFDFIWQSLQDKMLAWLRHVWLFSQGLLIQWKMEWPAGTLSPQELW